MNNTPKTQNNTSSSINNVTSGISTPQNKPFEDNKSSMIGSTRDLNSSIRGIRPTNIDSGISSVGQVEMNTPQQVDTSYEPQKKKFPLSLREIILVSIAIIGVIVVVIMYWPKN